MRLWQTFCAAVTLGTFLFACEGSKTAKKTSDEDEDEQDTKPATAQSSPSGSAATSATTTATSSASAVSSEESTKEDDAPPGTPADAVLLDDGKRVIALSVKPDGSTSLLAFQSGEKGSLTPIEAEKLSGKVRSDEGEWLDLVSGKDGASAKLPKLEPGLTIVQLALEIAGEAFEESIDVPEGGTASLTDDSTVTVAPGTKGPNGGTVEVVGKQRVEVVIDEETDDVRVYFLNEKLEVMEVPEGTDITLAIEHEGGTK